MRLRRRMWRFEYTLCFSKHTVAWLVWDGFGNQKVRTDFFNISVGQPDLVLDVAFGGLVFLAEPAEERSDPLRP